MSLNKNHFRLGRGSRGLAVGIVMPRFFFTARGHGNEVLDYDGALVPDLDTARSLALESVREMIRDEGLDPDGWVFEITGEAGDEILLVVPFSDVLTN